MQKSVILDNNNERENVEREEGSEPLATEAETQVVNEQLLLDIRDNYETFKLRYTGVSLEDRPTIPKLQFNAKIIKHVTAADTILHNDLQHTSSLNTVTELVYCAALAVCQSLGRNIKEKTNSDSKGPQKRKEETPPWKKRIEEKINKSRCEIGHLPTYFASPQRCSTRVKKAINA